MQSASSASPASSDSSCASSERRPRFSIRESQDLSPRIEALRAFYFEGVRRSWNNEFTSWTTGTPWDVQYDEFNYYIVPETYAFLQTFRTSFQQASRPVKLPQGFFKMSLPERRATFIREVMLHYVPQELWPGDLLAGARFNLQASRCLTRKEARARDRLILGRSGARAATLEFHSHGYGNAGATSGHLIPDYERVLKEGFRGIYADLEDRYQALSFLEKRSPRGAQLRAMMISAQLPRELAAKYSALCAEKAIRETDPTRKIELEQMVEILRRVPWEPARTFWEALQSLWLTHMLVMADENYPGPGVSFGRLDQMLLPFYQTSSEGGMDRAFARELLHCFQIHANTAYDAMIRVGGHQGITAGFGQLFNLSGLGSDGKDLTNDLTYLFLEVIDAMHPILEPKPNVRLHRDSPEALLDKVVDMLGRSQGAPFLLNFDERSMAGMMRQARLSGKKHLISEANVHDYACVGCLENTMVGNDRSGTVNVNLNLVKAVELALNDGRDLEPVVDPVTLRVSREKQTGPHTGLGSSFSTFDAFMRAFELQLRALIRRAVALYERTEALRARYSPTPYLSCLVRGCAEKGLDVTQGGAELSFITIEGVTFATTVDSLLSIKYLVFDAKACTLDELAQALRDNWVGHDILQARARFRAPRYGRDDPQADALAEHVMAQFGNETWKHRTRSTGAQFRPGMLSWNYWVGDSHVVSATADGRPKGQFLSNAICPSNGADIAGPTANVNSVGRALGGRVEAGDGDWETYRNYLPNGASHTITFSPTLFRDETHKAKFKAFLRAYAQNGGTALQVNVLDAEMLLEAQRHPQDYRNLLVRVTGYNAYFASIGRELQDEIIARESHHG